VMELGNCTAHMVGRSVGQYGKKGSGLGSGGFAHNIYISEVVRCSLSSFIVVIRMFVVVSGMLVYCIGGMDDFKSLTAGWMDSGSIDC
jgi:hypothetical protein